MDEANLPDEMRAIVEQVRACACDEPCKDCNKRLDGLRDSLLRVLAMAGFRPSDLCWLESVTEYAHKELHFMVRHEQSRWN